MNLWEINLFYLLNHIRLKFTYKMMDLISQITTFKTPKKIYNTMNWIMIYLILDRWQTLRDLIAIKL